MRDVLAAYYGETDPCDAPTSTVWVIKDMLEGADAGSVQILAWTLEGKLERALAPFGVTLVSKWSGRLDVDAQDAHMVDVGKVQEAVTSLLGDLDYYAHKGFTLDERIRNAYHFLASVD